MMRFRSAICADDVSLDDAAANGKTRRGNPHKS